MAIKDFTIRNLFDTNNTIAADFMHTAEYPWELLPNIEEFIIRLGNTLPEEQFEKRGDHIWISREAHIFDSAYIAGPCIVDAGAELRQCAFVRGKAIVGKGSVVGNSCELKNVILFDHCEVPHFNYVGDSILGFHAHMGAGAITSNIKADRTNVVIRDGDERRETGLRKMGAMLGDWAEIGCNCVLNPGTIIGAHTNVYPLSMIRGCVSAGSIYKDEEHIVPKHD